MSRVEVLMTTKQRSEAKYMTPDEARAAVQRLETELAVARDDLVLRQLTLAGAEATIGDRLVELRLSGDALAETAAQAAVGAARTAVDLAEKMIDALDARIRESAKDVHIADAHALRAQAAELWKAVAPRLAETNRMIDALAEREGTRWMPWPVLQPSGVYMDGSWRRTKTGETLAAIIERERAATHLETRAGAKPGPSCLPADESYRLHLGNGGMLRTTGAPLTVGNSQLIPEPGRKVTAQDIAREYQNAAPLKG
jgi:hypothetical protein